jgi:hypothetical protein
MFNSGFTHYVSFNLGTSFKSAQRLSERNVLGEPDTFHITNKTLKIKFKIALYSTEIHKFSKNLEATSKF